jgi:hypothetical protein
MNPKPMIRVCGGLNHHVVITDWFVDEERSFEFTDDPNDRPTLGVNVRVLYLATSIGGTHRRVNSGRSLDLELEGMREDTVGGLDGNLPRGYPR